jgi:hypothetical protein
MISFIQTNLTSEKQAAYLKTPKMIYGKPHMPLRAELNITKVNSHDYELTPIVEFHEPLEEPHKLFLDYELPESFEVLKGELSTWIDYTKEAPLPNLLIRSTTEQVISTSIIHLNVKLKDFSTRTAISVAQSKEPDSINRTHEAEFEEPQLPLKRFNKSSTFNNKSDRFISSEKAIYQ